MAMDLPARMPEPACAAGGLAQFVHLDELGALATGEDHLRDALAVPDGERLAAVVDHDDPDLAAVVRVDGARRVHQRDAVPERQAASGSHLRLDAGGDLDGY